MNKRTYALVGVMAALAIPGIAVAGTSSYPNLDSYRNNPYPPTILGCQVGSGYWSQPLTVTNTSTGTFPKGTYIYWSIGPFPKGFYHPSGGFEKGTQVLYTDLKPTTARTLFFTAPGEPFIPHCSAWIPHSPFAVKG